MTLRPMLSGAAMNQFTFRARRVRIRQGGLSARTFRARDIEAHTLLLSELSLQTHWTAI